jgi:regulator of replication initiation timing
MIPLTIALIGAGVVIVALAIICAFVIQSNNGLAREKDVAQHDLGQVRANMKTLYAEKDDLRHENGKLQRAMTDIDTLGSENSRLREENTDLGIELEQTRLICNKVLAERNELAARNTALVEAMEAKPTQPKRTVRKNSQAGGEQ